MEGTITVEFKTKMQDYCCDDIFCEIDSRLIKAIMFHSEMTYMFSFLGLHGFKRLHEFQHLSESKERTRLHYFYLDHTNRLIKTVCSGHDTLSKGVKVIPSEWSKYTRMDISNSVVSKYVKQAFEQYKEWEEETKCMYECCACILAEKGELCLSNYVSDMADEVDMELKKLYRIIEGLNIAEYDWMYILDIQKNMHDKYKKCLKKVYK